MDWIAFRGYYSRHANPLLQRFIVAPDLLVAGDPDGCLWIHCALVFLVVRFTRESDGYGDLRDGRFFFFCCITYLICPVGVFLDS